MKPTPHRFLWAENSLQVALALDQPLWYPKSSPGARAHAALTVAAGNTPLPYTVQFRASVPILNLRWLTHGVPSVCPVLGSRDRMLDQAQSLPSGGIILISASGALVVLLAIHLMALGLNFQSPY